MSVINKIKWILGILLVFFLIIATNLIDRDNFIRVRDSVETIYEDRLIAKNILFEISKAIHKKELAIVSADSTFFTKQNAALNNALENLLKRYELTKLTDEESKMFNDLKNNFTALKSSENTFVTSGYQGSEILMGRINSIKDNLDNLSEVQIIEGNRQLAISNRALESVELFTQIEIYVLIFLAVAIQIIIMYDLKKS